MMDIAYGDAGLAFGLLVWSWLWYIRARKSDLDASSDILVIIICEFVCFRRAFGEQNEWNAKAMIYYIHICLNVVLRELFQQRNGDAVPLDSVASASPRTNSEASKVMKPRIFPCRTKHTRLFPQRNSFTYPYLQVGIPIGWNGCDNSLLSSGSGNSLRKPRGWFHVDSADYLQRDNRSLEDKLDAYLRDQEVNPDQYPYAYLVTAPRVFGYAFNPVSFWYLYDVERRLRAMILEVNNTFDERRMYFLKAAPSAESEVSTDEAKEGVKDAEVALEASNEDGGDGHGEKVYFTDAWEKDFHVSPFNSRKGSYALKAEDVRPWDGDTQGRVSNAITLVSSQKHGKLVASISSIAAPIDLSSKGQTWRTRWLLARWAFTGFLTFPRILRQAWKLFFDRKLHVWFRPEVTKQSIARNATKDERIIESFFASYLRDVTEKATTPLKVQYMSAPGVGHIRGAFSANCSAADQAPETLEIRVISPVFYSRLIHYPHIWEALDRECLCADAKDQTVIVSRPELPLQELLGRSRKDPGSSSTGQSRLPIMERMRWHGLRLLRCPPPIQSYCGSDGSSDVYRHEDIRSGSLSRLDEFVICNCPDGWIYRRVVTKLFLARRLVGGLPVGISALDLGLRSMMIAASLLFRGDNWPSSTETLFGTRYLAWSAAEGGPATPWDVLILVATLNANHAWAWLKGF